MGPAVEVSGLVAHYPDSAVEALRGVSLLLPRGARAALVGPNGAGKSTLLKTLAGLHAPSAGTVRVLGHAPGQCQHQIAYVPQRSEIDWDFPMSLGHLVLTGRYVHLGWLRRPGAIDHAAAEAALALLGLTDLARRQIGQLSGGQQQRALLARAFAQEAELLLLDEPLNAVDQATRLALANALDEARERGRTVVMATHDLDALPTPFDHILRLRHGELAETTAPLVSA